MRHYDTFIGLAIAWENRILPVRGIKQGFEVELRTYSRLGRLIRVQWARRGRVAPPVELAPPGCFGMFGAWYDKKGRRVR